MSEEINKLIDEKLEELYNSLMEKPLRVLSIFNDFFGEERVDMQDYISLERFKSWLRIAPIYEYISWGELINMSRDEWSIYQYKSIEELPTSQVIKVIDNFQEARNKVGLLKFSHIFILIHFPHVRVTNEHDKFVDINHLWAKVQISYDGTLSGKFTLNRSEYTMLHMISDYLHSHVSSIPRSDFTKFKTPCTGTGPINETMCTLNREYDEDMWNMFCLELSKYVTVESINGVPYHYLEKLGTNNMEMGEDRLTTYTSPYYICDIIPHNKIKEFVRYFINKKKLKFNYANSSYSIGMSLPEYIILISNEFISWYNNLFNKGEVTATFGDLKRNWIIRECIIDNGKIYYESDRNNVEAYLDDIGKKVCIFKGKEITVDITDIAEIRNENKSIILNVKTALYILNIILNVLNYRYGRETDTTENNQSSTKVKYLL